MEVHRSLIYDDPYRKLALQSVQTSSVVRIDRFRSLTVIWIRCIECPKRGPQTDLIDTIDNSYTNWKGRSSKTRAGDPPKNSVELPELLKILEVSGFL